MQYQPYVPEMQPNNNLYVSNSGLDALLRCRSIFVKQRPDYLESLGFFEIKNVYYVYESDAAGSRPDFDRSVPFLKCKEDSECCQRNCLPGNCRSFEMKIKQYDQRQDKHTVLRISREYHCTCLCYGRPLMELFTEQGVKLGQIFYPFFCCDKGVIVQDANGNTIYSVIGSCCQWPFLVNLPCETCQRAVFEVRNLNGQVVTEIRKESAGFMESWCSDATAFSVIFPPNADSVQKALLMATTLFLDMNYFERSPQDQNNNENNIFNNI